MKRTPLSSCRSGQGIRALLSVIALWSEITLISVRNEALWHITKRHSYFWGLKGIHLLFSCFYWQVLHNFIIIFSEHKMNKERKFSYTILGVKRDDSCASFSHFWDQVQLRKMVIWVRKMDVKLLVILLIICLREGNLTHGKELEATVTIWTLFPSLSLIFTRKQRFQYR